MKRKRCTICGKKFDIHDKYADLHFKKEIGYGSVHDGEVFELNLCCKCFDNIAELLDTISKVNIFVR